MDEARGIAHRLVALSDAMAKSADQAQAADEASYRASSAALVNREGVKLAEALGREDQTATAWALRSVADMMKGLIDVGADFPCSAPSFWQEASDLADQAHAIGRASR